MCVVGADNTMDIAGDQGNMAGCNSFPNDNVSNTEHAPTSVVGLIDESFFSGDIMSPEKNEPPIRGRADAGACSVLDTLSLSMIGELFSKQSHIRQLGSSYVENDQSVLPGSQVKRFPQDFHHDECDITLKSPPVPLPVPRKCNSSEGTREVSMMAAAESVEKDLLELLSSPIGIQVHVSSDPSDLLSAPLRGRDSDIGQKQELDADAHTSRLSVTASEINLVNGSQLFAGSPTCSDPATQFQLGRVPDDASKGPRNHIGNPSNGSKELLSNQLTNRITITEKDNFVQRPSLLSTMRRNSSSDNQGLDGGLNSYDKRLRERSLAIFSATDEQKKRPMKKSRTYSKAVPSRFCHICTRQSKKSSPHAFCLNINRGACRKAVCEKCFTKFGWDWKTASAPGSQWLCPHCCNICPKGAQCYNYVSFVSVCEKMKIGDERDSLTNSNVFTDCPYILTTGKGQ